MLRGSSPIRLSQLDVAPIVQAAQVAEAADVNLSNAVNQSILNFTQKQEQKKQEKIAISSIQNLLGIDDPNLAKSVYKDEIVRDAYIAKQQSDAELQLAQLKAQQPPKLSAQEEKIQIFQDTFNLSRQDAVDLAQGTKRFITDPITKKSALVNIRTNEVIPVDVPQQAQDAIVSGATLPLEDSPPSINLYQMAETTTGFFPLLSAKVQGITGQVGIDVADEELLENIQTFKTAQQDIIRSLRASPKILATEMNRLAQELDISPGVGKDVKTLRAQLKSIDKSINSRIQNIEQLIADPNASAEDVRGARSLRNDLINFKRILGVPVEGEQDLSNIGNIANKYLGQ